MIGNKDKIPLKERKMVVKYVEDGILISDLTLASVLLTLLKNGTDCYQAILDDSDKSRFLFYIKGDPEVLKKTIHEFYSIGVQNPMEQLKEFVAKQVYLKTLIDKAREGGHNG